MYKLIVTTCLCQISKYVTIYDPSDIWSDITISGLRHFTRLPFHSRYRINHIPFSLKSGLLSYQKTIDKKRQKCPLNTIKNGLRGKYLADGRK